MSFHQTGCSLLVKPQFRMAVEVLVQVDQIQIHGDRSCTDEVMSVLSVASFQANRDDGSVNRTLGPTVPVMRSLVLRHVERCDTWGDDGSGHGQHGNSDDLTGPGLHDHSAGTPLRPSESRAEPEAPAVEGSAPAHFGRGAGIPTGLPCLR